MASPVVEKNELVCPELNKIEKKRKVDDMIKDKVTKRLTFEQEKPEASK